MISTANSRSSVYLGTLILRDKETHEERITNEIKQFSGDEHILLIGPTRSGKGRRVIAPNLILDTTRSVLVVDPKGELAWWTSEHRKKTGHQVFYLDPFKELAKHYPTLKAIAHGFNPLLALDPQSPDFVDDAMSIAEALVMIESHDPHWSTSAQDLVAGLIMQERAENAKNPSLSNVRKVLIKSPDKISIMAANFCDHPLHEAIPSKLEKYRDAKGNKELGSIISTAQTQTRFLDSPLIADSLSHGEIDFQKMKDERITIYLVIPPARIATHAKWLRLVVGSAVRGLQKTRRHTSKPDVMLVLDEFPQLGRMESIETSMALNAGYGIKIFAIVQHLGQLQHQYQGNWQTFLSGGAIASFAPRDDFTSKHLSDLAGQEMQEVMSRTISHDNKQTLSFNQQLLSVIQPVELRRMDEGRMLLFLPSNKGQRMSYTFAPDFSALPEVNKHIRK